MKSTQFFYVEDVAIDNITGKKVTVMRPKLPIRISINKKLFPNIIEALFDTGADRNLFPADFLKYFNVKLEKGKPQLIKGIGNSPPIPASTHKVSLFLGVFKIDTEIDFTNFQPFPILGRETFMNYFDHFIVNQKKLYIEVFSP